MLANTIIFSSVCQNLARQMVEHNISPITYTLKFSEIEDEMRNNTSEVLRNVQLLEQKHIVICSPRDDTYNMIQLVLEEVTYHNYSWLIWCVQYYMILTIVNTQFNIIPIEFQRIYWPLPKSGTYTNILLYRSLPKCNC